MVVMAAAIFRRLVFQVVTATAGAFVFQSCGFRLVM